MCGFVSQLKLSVCLSDPLICCEKDLHPFEKVSSLITHALLGHYSNEAECSDRQTVLIWDTNPHTPRLYFKPAPPLHLPRHNDLQGSSQPHKPPDRRDRTRETRGKNTPNTPPDPRTVTQTQE